LPIRAGQRAAFLESVQLGVDAIVVGRCFETSLGRAVILGLLDDTNSIWSRPLCHEGFSLRLRASLTKR